MKKILIPGVIILLIFGTVITSPAIASLDSQIPPVSLKGVFNPVDNSLFVEGSYSKDITVLSENKNIHFGEKGFKAKIPADSNGTFVLINRKNGDCCSVFINILPSGKEISDFISKAEFDFDTKNMYFQFKGYLRKDSVNGIKGFVINENTNKKSYIKFSDNKTFTGGIKLQNGKNKVIFYVSTFLFNLKVFEVNVNFKPERCEVLKIGSGKIKVNGKIKSIDKNGKTFPLIIRKWERTVVPIRAIVENAGGTVNWDPVQRMVTIRLNGTTIKLWIGKSWAEVNGKTEWIDEKNHNVKPVIINSRTMIPLRFVGESLGAKVTWISSSKEIIMVFP